MWRRSVAMPFQMHRMTRDDIKALPGSQIATAMTVIASSLMP